MLVLGFDCAAASNPWLARLRPVIQVKHASSGNVTPVLGLPFQGQQQDCVHARDDVGSPFVVSFSGSASASRYLAVICEHVDVCTCMYVQACISPSIGWSVLVVHYRQQWFFLLQVNPAGLYGFLFSFPFV